MLLLGRIWIEQDSQDNVRNYYSQNAAGAWNGARNFYKKWATASIFALIGVSQTPVSPNVLIDFGRNENQIDHAARHVLDKGYNLDAVQGAIREQLRNMSESLSNGPYTGNVISLYTSFFIDKSTT